MSDQAASLNLRNAEFDDSISKMMLAYGEDKSGFILDEEKEYKKLRALAKIK